jgi:hypothetical protein
MISWYFGTILLFVFHLATNLVKFSWKMRIVLLDVEVYLKAQEGDTTEWKEEQQIGVMIWDADFKENRMLIV